jgi:hypothetical protein
MMEINPHAFGVDDIAGLLLALRQIVFSAWVSLNEQKRSTLGEGRGVLSRFCHGRPVLTGFTPGRGAVCGESRSVLE